MSETETQPEGNTPSILAGYLSPEQLADQLGISLRTLARWHQARKGPARCEVGKLIVYRVETVRAWLANIERGAPEPTSARRRS